MRRHTYKLGLSLPAALVREDSAAVQVESALCYGIIFVLMLGVMQFCMMIYTYGVYAEAARVGVRYAVAHGTDNTSSCSGPTTGCSDSAGANVITAVKNYAAGYISIVPGMQVSATYPDSSSTPPSRIVVRINYTYVPFATLAGFHQTFQITVQGRIWY